MKAIKCMTKGRVYDRYVRGELENPDQVILCTNIEPCGIDVEGLVVATIAEDTKVSWKNKEGDIRTFTYVKGQKTYVLRDFIVDIPTGTAV